MFGCILRKQRRRGSKTKTLGILLPSFLLLCSSSNSSHWSDICSPMCSESVCSVLWWVHRWPITAAVAVAAAMKRKAKRRQHTTRTGGRSRRGIDDKETAAAARLALKCDRRRALNGDRSSISISSALFSQMDHFLKNQTAIKLICPLSDADRRIGREQLIPKQ